MAEDNFLEEFLAGFNKENKISTKYNHSSIDLEIVENNIDEFIIPELQEACKILWSKNIATHMTSNYEGNDGYCFISLEKLSKENMDILRQLNAQGLISPPNIIGQSEKKSDGLPGWYGYYALYACGNDIAANGRKLKELVSHFQMQDIPEKYSLSAQQYLQKHGCYKEIPNPNYDPNFKMPEIYPDNLEDLDKLLAKMGEPATIEVFDPSKQTKSLEEIIKENNDDDKFDAENKRIYVSKYYYDKHLNYIDYIAKENENENV